MLETLAGSFVVTGPLEEVLIDALADTLALTETVALTGELDFFEEELIFFADEVDAFFAGEDEDFFAELVAFADVVFFTEEAFPEDDLLDDLVDELDFALGVLVTLALVLLEDDLKLEVLTRNSGKMTMLPPTRVVGATATEGMETARSTMSASAALTL